MNGESAQMNNMSLRADIWGNNISKGNRNYRLSFADNPLSKDGKDNLIKVHYIESVKAHNAKNTFKVKENPFSEEDDNESCCCNMF